MVTSTCTVFPLPPTRGYPWADGPQPYFAIGKAAPFNLVSYEAITDTIEVATKDERWSSVKKKKILSQLRLLYVSLRESKKSIYATKRSMLANMVVGAFSENAEAVRVAQANFTDSPPYAEYVGKYLRLWWTLSDLDLEETYFMPTQPQGNRTMRPKTMSAHNKQLLRDEKKAGGAAADAAT
jgi:hypothetical protein